MSEIIEVSDISAPELSVFARLTETQLKSRLDPAKGLFIAESPKVINIALDAGYAPVSLLMGKKHILGDGAEIIEKAGCPVYTAEDSLLEELTGYKLTRGILCAFKRPAPINFEDIISSASRIAVLENIVDATNLGAIVRSAAALNIDAVLFTPSCCDPLNRRAVRVSMGTIFQIPFAWIGDEPSFWSERGIETLHSCGFKTVAMALEEHSFALDDERLKKEEKLAVILGTEGDGLAKRTIASCDYTVKIPMFHGVDSLNVAAASAVAFWELRKR